MFQVKLVAINARYAHASLGLRYIKANLGEFQEKCEILEFTISENAPQIARKILESFSPQSENGSVCILGFGVYIWNVDKVRDVLDIINKVRPDLIGNIKIVLGGPEVSYDIDTHPLFPLCDFVIPGEGEFSFKQLVEAIHANPSKPQPKIYPCIKPAVPDISKIQLPYGLYSDHDIQHRVIYVEASRGCPFTCEYCLSSLDAKVRDFDLDLFLSQLKMLIDKGAKGFKFIDRTFNLKISHSQKILQFFLSEMKRVNRIFDLHFEMVPDRFPEELKALIVQFPKGSIQFEIGVQTLNPEVSKNVSRRQNVQKLKENIAYLMKHTNVHLHVDLIVGLPGESFESFKKGFNELAELEPHEIQVGVLKRLRGTPIVRHDASFKMRYSTTSPYTILQNQDLDFFQIQRLTVFADFWDKIANSGEFNTLVNYLLTLLKENKLNSLFSVYFELSQKLYRRFQKTHSIGLPVLVEEVAKQLPEVLCVLNPEFEFIHIQQKVWDALHYDYTVLGKRDVHSFFKSRQGSDSLVSQNDKTQKTEKGMHQRQKKHVKINE